MRFIGHRDGRIVLVSDKPLTSTDFQVMELPVEFESYSSEQLILECQVRDQIVYSKSMKRNPSELKIAFVGNWKMSCGISTYSEKLWPEILGKAKDYRLFIEENSNPTQELDETKFGKLDLAKIIPCWKRGENLGKLITAIKEFDPDIVFIQHEFGLFPVARYWLSLMTQLDRYRVVVTIHSTFHHADKTIVEAAIPELVVHLEGARKLLTEEKKIPGKVYVIPHGCDDFQPGKLWNFYRTPNTFIQAGFGFEYKGWGNSLKAVALLKDKYPDVYFTGLFSESDFNKAAHQLYYNELLKMIEELGIQDHAALIRGFQSDESLDSYLRTNSVAVFPYISQPKHEVWGASGAARLAMSKGLPVISSSVNHFSDLPTLKADSPEAIADHLDRLFSSKTAKEQQVKRQAKYLKENSWANVAQKYLDLFCAGV